MSQIMERWPWPKSYWIKNSDNHSDPSETMTAVKLVLWPSGASDHPIPDHPKPSQVRQPKPKRMWSKLPPLKQIHTKMNWLRDNADPSNHVNSKQVSKQNNAVFRSNSFRFERPPPEDDARMYSRHYKGIQSPVKSYSITAQDVANLNDKYETPKDLVNHHKPLRSYMTPRNSQKVIKNRLGVHVATLESNPLDVVYSDPKDSKLYQIPGAEAAKPIAAQDLAEINQPYKVYMSPIREDQYCRPYVTMRPFMQQQTSGPSMPLMSEYEEVNAGPNCVTMITVMPENGTAPSTLTSSASGTTGNEPSTALSSDNEVASMAAGASSTRESETSSSEGGSFIIDSAAFYENLHFHNRMFKTPGLNGQRTSIEDLSVIHSSSAQHPWVSKFGYSPKEVWNWLYTEHDLNHNLMQHQQLHRSSSKIPAAATNSSVKRSGQAVEVKFTLSEFVNCYKRLLGLNLEGFAEFVSRTLEAIVSTSMYYNQQKQHQKSSMTASRKAPSSTSCQKSVVPNFVMVPTSLRQSSSQNKTYVRLSMPSAQATQLLENNNHLTCYQTLMDVNNPKYASTTASAALVMEDMILPGKNHLKVDLSVPLDRQEWYHGSITRHEAENALRLHEEGSFLVRNSESSTNDYSLSVKTTRGFMHMKIQERSGQGYILGQFSKPFRTIAQMLLYYSRNSLPVKGIEHISLKKPVCEQLL